MGKKDTQTEIQRTCNRCGTVRYVSLEVARTKVAGPRAMKWVELASVIGSKSQRGTFATQKMRLDLEKERVTAAMRCPKCGSESFSEVEFALGSSAAIPVAPPGSGAAFRRAKRSRPTK